MIDDKIAQKIRLIQAKQIKKTKQNASFSAVLNELLWESLK